VRALVTRLEHVYLTRVLALRADVHGVESCGERGDLDHLEVPAARSQPIGEGTDDFIQKRALVLSRRRF
jgi:hypothetical protein